MIYAQIVGGRVHGLFDYDTLPEFAPDIVMVPLPPDSPVQPGWQHLGEGQFEAPAPVPVQVPVSVKMRAAQLALIDAGLLAGIEAAIDSIPGVEGDRARVEWRRSETLRRDHPLLAELAPLLNLTDEMIDGLFLAAAEIQ